MTFEKEMARRLRSIESVARSTANHCESNEFECCILHQNLLNLESEIKAAISALSAANRKGGLTVCNT